MHVTDAIYAFENGVCASYWSDSFCVFLRGVAFEDSQSAGHSGQSECQTQGYS